MHNVHKNEVEDDIETVINMTNRNGKNVENKHRKIAENENRKAQKRKKRIKRIIKWTSIIIIIAGGLAFALTSPLFNVKEIEVENNNVLTKEKIVSLSRLNKEENIFRFLKSDIEKYIKEEPYIENVKIKRELPSTVKIEVQERNRDFALRILNSYAYINNQGYILEITEDSLGLPIIDGVETPEEDIQPGKRLNNNDLKKLEVAIQIMKIAKENEIDSKISGIDISDKNEYILYLATEKKTAHLGDSSNLPTKILYIKEIMENYETGKEGTIYVNGDFTKNFKAYFREKV
ncbi:MAG: FtsQ-type POTRA domain-containing protein [Clostridia bacterium]|nr:FtsQ-type POTRA domain-containing protein [Clostridia bacterium]